MKHFECVWVRFYRQDMIYRKRLFIPVLVIAIVAGALLADSLLPSSVSVFRNRQTLGGTGVVQPSIPTGLTWNPEVQQPPTTQDRMVIYNAQLSLETGEIQVVVSKIATLAEGYGGYVAGSSLSTYGTQTVAEIIVRIPKDRFRVAVGEIEGLGKVLDERTTSDDVTQQYIDLRARLGNLQRQEESLQAILAMAKTVDEVLQVERELERVRGEIESLQGQINYIEGNVEMSNIMVQLTEPQPPFTPPGMDWGETLQISLAVLFAVVRGLIILAIGIAPLAAIAIPAFYIYRRRTTKRTA